MIDYYTEALDAVRAGLLANPNVTAVVGPDGTNWSTDPASVANMQATLDSHISTMATNDALYAPGGPYGPAAPVTAPVAASGSTEPLNNLPYTPPTQAPATAPVVTQPVKGITSPGVLDQADITALNKYIATLTASGSDPAKLALYQQRLKDYTARLAAPAPTTTAAPTPSPQPDAPVITQPVGTTTNTTTAPVSPVVPVTQPPAKTDYTAEIAALNKYIANLTASGTDPAKLATYTARLADYSSR
jgi:hypothetical protein